MQICKQLAQLPRVRLISEPTPLEPMRRLQENLGCGPLYVKRDDCMPLGAGGNKVRSLEFWIGRALSLNADIIVVAGAQVSNQCRLAAAAAAKVGLKCLILHSSETVDIPNGNLLLNYLLGAEISFIGNVNEARRREIADKTIEELRREGRTPYLIGDSTVGAAGYLAGAFELYEQSNARGLNIKHVFIPGSMGTTEAGFILGNTLLSSPFTVHIVSVEYDKSKLSSLISGIYAKAIQYMGLSISPDSWREHTVIHDQYLGEGYDIPTLESIDAISILARYEGFFIENTYTSKTAAGMLDQLKRKEISNTEATCFLHTGGVPALFTQQAQLRKLFS